MPDLTAIARTLQTLFTDEAIRLAHETGLVRRNSKLTGPLLLLVLVAGFIQHPTASYNILAQVAADYGVLVTRQAVQQRLTAAAVAFFQHLLGQSLHLLATHCRLSLPLLTQFAAVYLLDSSQVALPPALAAAYPGTGGDGPAAGVKWQVLWELLSGSFREILAQPAKESDQRYDGYLAQVRAGSLILFDLGYVALTRLQQLLVRQVYFICRWNPRFEAFTLAGQPFDLRAHLAACTQPQIELDLRVGVQAQVPVRVVAVRLPPTVREQRRRRAHATERKRGFTYSAAYKALLDWNVYVTNVPPARLTGAQVSQVYRLRWQVELLFKLWKMQGALDRVAGRQAGRVMCELYAKLIGMVVFGYLSAPVRMGDEQELSPGRAWQVWQRQIANVGHALRRRRGLPGVLARLYTLWECFGQKDRRRDRSTSLGQFRLEKEARPQSAARVVEWRARAQPQQGRLAA
jgi:Transposase DDE domain